MEVRRSGRVEKTGGQAGWQAGSLRGRIVKKVQAKVSDSPAHIAKEFKHPQYNNMQRATTSDKAANVKKITQERIDSNSAYAKDYKNSLNNIADNSITDGKSGVSSGGTSSNELLDSIKNDKIVPSLIVIPHMFFR